MAEPTWSWRARAKAPAYGVEGGVVDDLRLVGRQVEMRPVTPAEHGRLYECVMSERVGIRWRVRGASMAFDDFVRGLWSQVSVHYAVYDWESGRICGYVNCHSANPRDGWAFVSGFAAPEYIGTGLMAEAGILFVDHLFAQWPYRKLYFDVPAYNEPSLASAVRDVLVEEGNRRAYYFFDGAYHDDRTYALWRERWMAARDRLLGTALGRCAGPVPGDSGVAVTEQLGLDRFCRRVAEELGRRPEAVQPESNLLDDLAVDSLEMLVLEGVLEELAGTRCSYEVDHLPATVRDLFLLYCELGSSPPVPPTTRTPLGKDPR